MIDINDTSEVVSTIYDDPHLRKLGGYFCLAVAFLFACFGVDLLATNDQKGDTNG